ncbi:MAG: SOS response-associated peptidase [Actinobacteria bacterium]|nr:SOS response-associated peptidase [Actinomycetota bacterium]
MCGRYTLRTPIDVLAEEFQIEEYPSLITPNYNVAPTQEVAAVVEEDDKRKLEMFHWGLIPSWAKDPAIGNKMINARAETVSEKPSFRKAFKVRRCLILADGFYEWQKIDSGKQPYHIKMQDGLPFAFAGLWETWGRNGEEIRSCSIITTEANDLMNEIHHRMPVILPTEDYAMWLDPDFDEKEPLTSLLKPYPADAMEAYPVSRRVNNPSNNEPGVVVPAA